MIRLVILTNVRISASRPYVCAVGRISAYCTSESLMIDRLLVPSCRRQDLRLSSKLVCRRQHLRVSPRRVCHRQDLRLLLGRVAHDSI